jgi:hypothetical protein
MRAVGVIASPFANGPCQNQSRKRHAENALYRDFELLREQGHKGVGTAQKNCLTPLSPLRHTRILVDIHFF